MRPFSRLSMLLVLGVAAVTVSAGDVRIRSVEMIAGDTDTWTARVTLEHADTGWAHYADAWRVVGPDGSVFGTRTLHHPHENEQPFTRQLSGIAIPAAVRRVRIEAHDKVHGWSPQRLEVDLSLAREGRVRVGD